MRETMTLKDALKYWRKECPKKDAHLICRNSDDLLTMLVEECRDSTFLTRPTRLTIFLARRHKNSIVGVEERPSGLTFTVLPRQTSRKFDIDGFVDKL
ncbi:MAG: hypothetical protein ACRCZZ_08255 [Phocaeicola sp.]